MMKKVTILLSLFTLILIVSCQNQMSSNSNSVNRDSLQTVCESNVSLWVKEYAMYPQLYQSQSFTNFEYSYEESKGEKIENSDNFYIDHWYSISSIDSVVKSVKHTFYLNYKCEVMYVTKRIENGRNISYASMSDVWREEFGRELSGVEQNEETRRILQHTLGNDAEEILDMMK